MSFAPYPIFLKNVALLIKSLVHTLTNKTVPLSINTVTSLKLAFLFFIMPMCLFDFGMTPSKPLAILSIVFLHPFSLINLPLKNYSNLLLIIHFSKSLAVHVGQIFAHIIPTNFNLVLLNVFFWDIVFFTRGTNVSIFLPAVFIFLGMSFLLKTNFHFLLFQSLLPPYLLSHHLLTILHLYSLFLQLGHA